MSPIYINQDGEQVELGEGRGDLRSSSIPFADWDGGPWWEGRPVSYAKVFATQPWVAIAVMRLLTWCVRVPLKVYERTDSDGGRRRLTPSEHPLAAAVKSPWDRGCMADLVTGILGPLWVHGNSITDVQSGAGDKLQFEAIDWRTICPLRFDDTDPNGEIVGWRINHPSGGTDDRSATTVMHLRWWSPLGQLGISPLRQLGSTLTAETAAIEWTITNLANAARPSGLVKASDGWLGLDKTERQTLLNQARDDLRKAYGGPRNAGKLPVLPPGLEWTAVNHTTAVEAELIAQRTVNRNEVSSVYMVPPPMIGILDKATYANIQTQREMAYTDGLAPPLMLAEQTINAHVIEGLLREPNVFVEFDFSGILRGDRLREIQAIREAISTAALTPNEGRDILNMPRSDAAEADKLYLPKNNLRAIDDPVPTKAAR